MKPRPTNSPVRSSGELTFAWRKGDEAVVRFWFAVLLSIALFVIAFALIRIVVPTSVAGNRPRVEKAQLVIVDESSHPSLLRLLDDRNLPSLGVEESVGEVPLVEDMLSVLGLAEERRVMPQLYPAPEEIVRSPWPKTDGAGLSLPSLPAIDESSWPQIEQQEAVQWAVQISGLGELGEVMKSRVAPWSRAVPAIRQARWTVIFDRAGRLVYAVPLDGTTASARVGIRGLLQQTFEAEAQVEPLPSGEVMVNFLRVAE